MMSDVISMLPSLWVVNWTFLTVDAVLIIGFLLVKLYLLLTRDLHTLPTDEEMCYA